MRSPTSRFGAGIYFCQFTVKLAFYIVSFVFNILLCATEGIANCLKNIVADVSIPAVLFRFHIPNIIYLFARLTTVFISFVHAVIVTQKQK
jgi:hypothetical protein